MDDVSTFERAAATDQGFPASPLADLLAQNVDLISRLKVCYGSDESTFEREVMPLVRRYAAYVHLLPATANNFFSSPGGLLRLGLEVGFFSLQGTDAHIFSGRSTISVRRHLEPRWRLATFIAGMCCESHRALSHPLITDAAGKAWSGYTTPLADWLETTGTARYEIRWPGEAQECRGLGLFALPHVVPAPTMTYLADGNTVILPHLLASVGGAALHRDHNVLDDLVRRALALVIDRSLVAESMRSGKPQVGAHAARFLVDTMRRLALKDPAWVPNREKSRVWHSSEGVFVIWPGAADDIRTSLEREQLRGMPRTADGMLDALVEAGVVAKNEPNAPVWSIRTPGAKANLDALRLISPQILFANIQPAPTPLDANLVVNAQASRPEPCVDVSVRVQERQPIPEQLSLLPAPEPASPVTSSAGPNESESAVATKPNPIYSLLAPFRLNPAVRAALEGIVRTLNADTAEVQCCTVAEGLFVPLDHFEQRGVSAAVAVRALGEVQLLAVRPNKDSPPTQTRDFRGVTTVGLVVDPRAIDGFDINSFLIAPHSKA